MKTKTQLNDLDLEVLNPIETKKIIGGEWYDYTQIPEVVIPWDGGGSGGGDPWGGYYDPTHGGGEYGDTGGGGADTSTDGILETPSARELAWLLINTSGADRDKMRDNVSKASLYANTQPGTLNGLGDALRHALWSALDAADLGLDKAKEFHTLHETANPVSDGSNAMDLHNNQWGFEWYSQHGNPDNNINQFLYDFFVAVNNGLIQTQPQP